MKIFRIKFVIENVCLKISQNLRTNGKKLAQNTFSFTYTIVALQDKKKSIAKFA